MTDKSISDVLDNAVNKIGDGVQSLGNSISKVAPDAWKVLVHQQKALAVQDIIIGVVFLLLILICAILYKKFLYNKFEEIIKSDVDFIPGQVICLIIFCVLQAFLLCGAISNLTSGGVRYSSAEYYAAKDVMEMVKK